jgi:HK97 family phage major capsid protein
MESRAMSKRSVQVREEAKAKHNASAEVLQLAGENRDFSKKEVLEKLGATDSADAVKKWRDLNEEAHILFGRAADAELDEDIKEHEDRETELKRPKESTHRHSATEQAGPQSFGRMFVESKEYKEWRQVKNAPMVGVEVPMGLKTLITTSAGLAPDSPRTADVVPLATRPIQILDLIPIDPVGVATVKWMEKTTFTISAAEIAEAATYPESVYVWTERSAPVQKLADSIPVTDEQIDDVDQMASLLDADLRFGVRQKLDSQVINGTGTPPQIRGILNYAGIQTQARAADPHFDAIFKAITKVRAVGRAEPDAVAIHSTDFQTIRLTRTADGLYIMGNPDSPGSMRLFGLPVAINEVLTAGTALVGDFARYARLKERKGIEVQVGYTGTQFTEGKKTLRADVRVAMVVRRAAAFCTVTGL